MCVYIDCMYLHIPGADKFSEIFLGEFDTPEAIWSSEMRWVGVSMLAAVVDQPRLLCVVQENDD